MVSITLVLKLGSLSKDDGDGNEKGKKATGLDWQNNNNLHVGSRLLYISLPSLHDYDVELLNFTFYGGREHKTTIFFFFLWT